MFSSRIPSSLAPNRLGHAVLEQRRTGRPFIDLTESNPTRVGFTYPPDLLAPLANPRALGYEPWPAWRRTHVAAPCRRARRPRHATPTSTSDAYSLLFKLLADAGDEVLVPRPSYPLFDHLTRFDLVAAHPYDLDLHGSWSIDFGSLERALTPRTRAVLVVSPNNPTGSFVTDAELDRLAVLCAPRDIAIIADEVFADYELEPGASSAAGRAARRREVLAFALGGLSKSVGLPQVKLGWIAVAGPDDLVGAALERLELVCDTYLAVSTPAQVAAAELIERGAAIRSQILTRIATNYQWLRSTVAGVPSCDALRSGGGWYAVLQVPSLEPEEDLVVRLLTADGVLTHPGYFFDFPRESFLVVSLLPPAPSFADGIVRVLRHFACRASRP